KFHKQRKFEQKLLNHLLDIAINELDLPKFPDPESHWDVRDWHVACERKANARRGICRRPSEGLSRSEAVSRCYALPLHFKIN
ncbi:hypothetical protein CH368_16720, partial [Leptospira levettii]